MMIGPYGGEDDLDTLHMSGQKFKNAFLLIQI